MRVCILGASGMLGHMLLYELSRRDGLDVWGTVRNRERLRGLMPGFCLEKLIDGVDAFDFGTMEAAIEQLRPGVVINCVGLIRQLPEGQQPLPCIELNSRLPHLLLRCCSKQGIRLIQYSSDCVFDGEKGSPYTEEDRCTASDVYGLSKYLGEVTTDGALTLRTSIIGHELRNKLSLVEWFLAQEGNVSGYAKAIYSGLTTSEHANVLANVILPNNSLQGLYHLASEPISKYELLCLIARVYGKAIQVTPTEEVNEDKRLSPVKFNKATGYIVPPWEVTIVGMHQSQQRYLRDIS